MILMSLNYALIGWMFVRLRINDMSHHHRRYHHDHMSNVCVCGDHQICIRHHTFGSSLFWRRLFSAWNKLAQKMEMWFNVFVSLRFVLLYQWRQRRKKADQLLSKKVKNFTFSHVSRANNVIKCWILTWLFSLSVSLCVSFTSLLSWCAIQFCYSMARFFTPRATQKNNYYYTFFLSFFVASE